MPVSVVSHEFVKKRLGRIGNSNAHEYFKDRFKLSLRDGKFCLFEHIDQHPLFVNNFGMASRLKRYVYSDHPLPPQSFYKRADNAATRHMGPYGG
jgi:cyclopropane fatty-acyl-phospholipid synthase-like methyltransferase